MKKIIALLSLVSLTAAFSVQASTVTESERLRACKKVKHLIPTEEGIGTDLETCLGFYFETVSETGSLKQIELQGQTVEDMATVCVVTLVKNPEQEIFPAPPFCDLR